MSVELPVWEWLGVDWFIVLVGAITSAVVSLVISMWRFRR